MSFLNQFYLLFLSVLALILYSCISSAVLNVQNAAKARKSGCEDAPVNSRPWWDVLGVVSLRRLLRSAHQGMLFEYLAERFENLRQRDDVVYRTLAVHRLGSTTFLTKEPENIKAVLLTNRENFTLERRVRWFGPLIGSKSFFTTDGSLWAHNRAIIKPALAKEHFSDLRLAEKHNNNLSQCLPTDSSGWTNETDLLPLFCRLTMDSSTEFLWGESVNSQLAALDDGSVEEDAFVTAYDRAQETLSKRMQLDGLYWLKDSLSFRSACRRCHDIVRPHIERVISSPPEKPKLEIDATAKPRYVLLEELAKQTRDSSHLQDTAMGLLLAGRDTTAALLGWLFYYLARYPETFTQLRSTIVTDFGTVDEPLEITFEKLKACKELQWCLNEALRLRPPVPLNGLNAVRDTILPVGGGADGRSPLFIPKGTRVVYSVLLMQTDEGIWGADAKEWRPERWASRKHGWDYLPFNGGPRICPGQQYALTLAAFTTVKLLQRFDAIENCDANAVIRMTPTLVSFSQNGVIVRLREAPRMT